MNKKQGNVFIPVGVLLLIILVFAIFLSYYQVNLIISNIKRDLYYVTKEIIFSLDIKELSYGNYLINERNVKDKMEESLIKEYAEGIHGIKEIQVVNAEITHDKDGVYVETEIKVKFKSIINLMGDNIHEFNIRENVDMYLMEY